MASNYTLETETENLSKRLNELWSEIEDNTPDLSHISDELAYVSVRAGTLADTARTMDEALSKIES